MNQSNGGESDNKSQLPEGKKRRSGARDVVPSFAQVVQGLLYEDIPKKEIEYASGMAGTIRGTQVEGYKGYPSMGTVPFTVIAQLMSLMQSKQSGILTPKQGSQLIWQLQNRYSLKLSNDAQKTRTTKEVLGLIETIKRATSHHEKTQSYSQYFFTYTTGKQKDTTETGVISLEQMNGHGKSIFLGGKLYRTVDYYTRLYPMFDTKRMFSIFRPLKKSIRILDESGAPQGVLIVIPDGLISSDNPKNYFDISGIQKEGKYYTLDGFSEVYGSEYDLRKIVKFSHPYALILKISPTLSLYNKEEIERVISSRKDVLEIALVESAGVDILDKPKAIIHGKLYMRANWRGFTNNPYFITYAQGKVANFSEVRKIHVTDKVNALTNRRLILEGERLALSQSIESRKERLVTLRANKNPSQRVLSIIAENILLLEDEENILFEILKKLSVAYGELRKLQKGITFLDVDGFVLIDGKLYLEEQKFVDALVGFSDPLSESYKEQVPYSGSIIHNKKIYVQDPSQLFIGVQIDWNNFLGRIPKHRIAEGDAPIYLYEEVVNELLKGGYVYADFLNKGMIEMHGRQWINITSKDALDTLATGLHRGELTVRNTVREIMSDIAHKEIPVLHLFNIDTGNMQILYDKREISKLILQRI